MIPLHLLFDGKEGREKETNSINANKRFLLERLTIKEEF
jgi:hypothetical protein